MMLRFAVAGTVLALSHSLYAAVNLTAPEEIVILAVNDQQVNAGLLRKKENNYTVDTGSIELAVRYQEYFEHLDGEHDIVKSGVVSIKTPPLVQGINYRLALIQAPKGFEEAKRYAEQPIIGLYDQQGKLLVSQQGANTKAKPWFGSGLFKSYDLTQKKQPASEQPVASYATASTASQVRSTQDTAKASPISSSTQAPASSDLIQSWKQATPEQRQRFMAWLAEQAN